MGPLPSRPRWTPPGPSVSPRRPLFQGVSTPPRPLTGPPRVAPPLVVLAGSLESPPPVQSGAPDGISGVFLPGVAHPPSPGRFLTEGLEVRSVGPRP